MNVIDGWMTVNEPCRTAQYCHIWTEFSGDLVTRIGALEIADMRVTGPSSFEAYLLQ